MPETVTNNRPKVQSFEVDPRIRLTIEPNLAIQMGELIGQMGTPNPALFALGKKLLGVPCMPTMPTSDTTPGKVPSFEIDCKLRLYVEFNLALELGELIEAANTPNKALFALGRKLVYLEPPEDEDEQDGQPADAA